MRTILTLLCLGALATGCTQPVPYDVIIRNGAIYDGGGGEPLRADVAIRGDRVVQVGDLTGASAELEVEAGGLAVAPGFINMLSWATESLLIDGNSQSDVRQGVTLEVFGEGWSMGPLSDAMKERLRQQQTDEGRFTIDWTTLGEYLESLERRGVSPNVASFVGATTVRIHVLGYEDRPPSETELVEMQQLVEEAMLEGALGVGSSLIYAPAFYAQTDELVALSEVAARHEGMYISHMRSEGNRLLEAIDELIEISRRAGLPAEIYHLKAAGQSNWDKLEPAVAKIDSARGQGLRITADMYTYTAGATGLDAAMPPWCQEGGLEAWIERLKDPKTRRRILEEMRTPSDDWENLLLAAGDASKVLLAGFRNEKLRPLTGKTLAAVAA